MYAIRSYYVTNYHVIANADQIIVALQDGRVLTADLVGVDVPTDLAVLAISADNLPVIPQNPELSPQVGDVVLAIGNVITSYSIHYTKLYDQILGDPEIGRHPVVALIAGGMASYNFV